MRLTVEQDRAKSTGAPERRSRQAPVAPEAPSAPLAVSLSIGPQAKPPGDLLALQRLVSGKPSPVDSALKPTPVSPPAVELPAASAGPAQDLIYRMTAEGERRGRAPGKKPEWTAKLKERDQQIGEQEAGGVFKLKDGSTVKRLDATEPFAPAAGVQIRHPVQPEPIDGVGLLNGALSLDVQNYSEAAPASEASGFTATYEFKGEARAGLIGLIKAKQTEEKGISNQLSSDQKLRERTFGSLKAVELTLVGSYVSANTEGSINNPRDNTHSYGTPLKQRVPAGEFYQPFNEALFTEMFNRLKRGNAASPAKAVAPAAVKKADEAAAAAAPAPQGGTAAPEAKAAAPAPAPAKPAAPDADEIAGEAWRQISRVRSDGEPRNWRDLADFITATSGRGFITKYGAVTTFLRTYYPEYAKNGVAALSLFDENGTTRSETNIPLNLFQNFITAFSGSLRSYFPIGALGLMWIEGKEHAVQAFYIGDAKGRGDEEKKSRLEVPKTLLEKVDDVKVQEKSVTTPKTGPNLTPAEINEIKNRVSQLDDKAYQLAGQILHVLIFPNTAKEDEFFVNRENHVVRKEDANDPFGLLQRYLRARSAGLQ